MSTFKAAETEVKKEKTFKELTGELFPFWQPLFTNMGISSPRFGTKLCYMGKEFGEPKVECVRFWESELSSGQDFYVELHDWHKEHYDRANRKLYRLVNNPNWRLNTHKYVAVTTGTEVGKTSTTYAVKVSDLELVNSTPVTAKYPEIISPISVTREIEEDEDTLISGMYSEKEDTHFSAMTLRDHYCITHNVPLSNKKWLNDLIKQGQIQKSHVYK